MRESERERRFEDLNTFPGRLRVEFNLLEVSIVRDSIPNQFRGTFLPREIDREKRFEVSFLCGGKEKIEGHHLRHRLHKRENEINIPKLWYYTLPDYDYNEGHHTIIQYEGQTPGSEKKRLWESMFTIGVENSSNKGYHTEKIIDAFLSKTFPIYWGCPNLEECPV